MNGDREYLIVDGYNILNNWPEFENIIEAELGHARDRLIEILANYQALTEQILIVVFDAHQVKGGQTIETEKGIQVIFSRKGETADAVIERLVYTLPKGERVTVATSDWLEQQIVLGKGGLRISARELRRLVLATQQKSKNHYQQGQKYYTLSGRLREDLWQALEELRRNR